MRKYILSKRIEIRGRGSTISRKVFPQVWRAQVRAPQGLLPSHRPELRWHADDDELFELEDSEEVSCTSEDSSEAQERKSHKRRKSLSLNTEGDSGLDADDQYDEDEVALQQAIAMSMAGNLYLPRLPLQEQQLKRSICQKSSII